MLRASRAPPLAATDRGRALCRPRRIAADFGIGSSEPSHGPSAGASDENAGEIRSRIASETTYLPRRGRREDYSNANLTVGPVCATPAQCLTCQVSGAAAMRWRLTPTIGPEPRHPQQGLRLTEERHAQIDARDKHTCRTKFCRNAIG